MSDLIEQRLKNYQLKSAEQELNALKEIAQELILCALSETGFFHEVYFLGGTSLRIIHGIKRFSEDLDFSLLKINDNFPFNSYIEKAKEVLLQFGLDMDVVKRNNDSFIKTRQLKNDSLKQKISFPTDEKLKKIVIKLELDTNPLEGVTTEESFLDFPRYHKILNADLSSIFAGKINAILTRSFDKGRD